MEVCSPWTMNEKTTAATLAPLNIINVEDIEEAEEVVEDDDSTTHALDRLSSAATCLVAGVEYTHGQQIYRDDPCEFCLCLDGEMFCWWQDCPPTLEGPCRDRLPFSPCSNGPRSSVIPLKESLKTSPTIQTTSSDTKTIEPHIRDDSSGTEAISTEITESSSLLDTTEFNENFETSPASNVVQQSPPKVCIVMGKKYPIGATLPHDTGNCVECFCDPGAHVTCSPHQCPPPGDDINDYRPPGPRPPLPDAF